MNNDFWAPVFEKLIENIEFLTRVCEDTADNDLISWSRPNPVLWSKAARFIRKKRVTDKAGLVSLIIDFAKTDVNLRKIILFTWIEKNKKTMDFTSLRADQNAFDRLLAQEFGSVEKIKILSQIDPRDGMPDFYHRFFDKIAKQKLEQNHDEEKIFNLQTRIENLEAILKAREKEIESAVAEKRHTEALLKAREKEIKSLQNRITQQKLYESELNAKINELEQKLSRQTIITTDTNEFSQQHKLKTQNTELEFKVSDLSARLEQAENEAERLQQTLERKTSSVERLINELAYTKNKNQNLESQKKQIQNLQKLLAETKENDYQKYYGQLIKINSDNNLRRWFLLSFAEELFIVSEKLVEKNQLCDGEFCCAEFDRDLCPTKIVSIEAGKQSIFGTLVSQNDQLMLKTADQSYRVFSDSYNESLINSPVRGTLLPGFKDRPEGIYRLSILKTKETEQDNALTKCSAKTICRLLNLHFISAEKLKNNINSSQNIIKSVDGQYLIFKDDYRKSIGSMRLNLDFLTVCDNSNCIEKALLKGALPKLQRFDEPCRICNKKHPGKNSKIDFENRKIIVIGGDYTGQDYCQYLSQFNLQVTWQSGFDNRKSFIGSLNNFDLVVIVIRQISHTLLREVDRFLEKHPDVKILYATKRGVSGIFKELCDYFKIAEKN